VAGVDERDVLTARGAGDPAAGASAASRRDDAPAAGRPRPWAFLLGAAAAYTAYTLYFLRPIWRLFPSHLTPDARDPLFNLYVLKWGAHQARSGFPDFWNANFYFPVRGALALSDHLLGPALLTAALPDAITAYNALLVVSFALSALSTAYMLRACGCGRFAAVLGGGAWAFAPFRLEHVNHLQLLLAQWLPLTIWFWHRLLARPSAGRAALFLLVYLLHVSGGSYLAYIVHVPLAVVALVHLTAAPRRLAAPRALAVVLPAVAAAGLATTALYQPYVETSQRLGLERPEQEVRKLGATPLSYLTPAPRSTHRVWLNRWLGPEARRRWRSENALFPGLVAGALAGFELVTRASPRRRRGPPAASSHDRLWERGLALSAAGCLLLTFPAVFLPLTRVVPGLSGLRAPTRFAVVVALAVAYFAARGADRLLARLGGARARAGAAMAALALLLAVELGPARALPWQRILEEERFPPVYGWLAGRDEVRALLEVPIRLDREVAYMYYSTRHWKPIANGFSGHRPGAYLQMVERFRWLPDRDDLALLHRRGVTHLVVHTAPFSRSGRHRQLAAWRLEHERAPRPAVRLEHAAAGDLVYAILGPGGSSTPDGSWRPL
jgi:hypothetical protein